MERKKKGLHIFSSRAKSLELDIEQFLAFVDQSVMLMAEAVRKYLDGDLQLFEEKTREVDSTERAADNIRRQIKLRLYADMLIPDSRGDVLGTLETTDNIADVAKRVASLFSIEKPQIFPFLVEDFQELLDTSVKAAQELTLAVRAFFCELYRVNEHLEKVYFWEHQADQIENRLKRKAFETPDIAQFSKRVHMRFFAERISLLADESEAVADRLSVYAIKRSM